MSEVIIIVRVENANTINWNIVLILLILYSVII